MKKSFLLMLLAVLVLVLAGCSSDPQDGANIQGNANQWQSNPYDYSSSYNPLLEEDDGTLYQPGADYDEFGNQVTVGATPIPIDPIDMPTATPRPSLTFQYGAVQAPNLGIVFEAPVGWNVDASDRQQMVLTDPNRYDGVNATLTIQMQNVSGEYDLADVKEQVKAMLKEIGQYNYTKWETTSTEKRTLLNKDGYYANYRGEMYDGTVVRGRVQVALLDGNRIIALHMKAPGWFNESYMKVVAQFRDTVQPM